jgi:peptidoglycan/LPS O-acetylase OafA/YrhL
LLAGRAYLAVDFFFALSGFVLARAYGRRLATREITALGFLRIRFIRLWPTAFIGTMLGAVVSLTVPEAMGGVRGLVPIAVAFASASLLLPSVTLSAIGAYPLNPPHWSIAFEIMINYVYALVAPKLATGRLAATVVLSAVWLASATIAHGNGNHLSPARVVFGFSIGVLMFRRFNVSARVRGWSLSTLSLALVVCLFLPTAIGRTGGVDAVIELFLLPPLVWFGASTQLRGRWARWCAWAGRASYPLHALHYPLLMVALAYR